MLTGTIEVTNVESGQTYGLTHFSGLQKYFTFE
jgi:hypothetical protein